MMLAGSLIAVKGGTLISQGAGLENLLKQNGKPELLSEAEPAAIASPLSSSAENDAGNEGDSQFSIPPSPPASQPILTRKQFSVSLPLLISKHRKKKLRHRTEQKCLQMIL